MPDTMSVTGSEVNETEMLMFIVISSVNCTITKSAESFSIKF